MKLRTTCLLLCFTECNAFLTVDKHPEEGDEISAILAESIESSSKKAEISPEDAAWVDSCLILDPHCSDNSWDAMRENLLESLTARAVHDEPGIVMEIAEPGEEAKETVEESVLVDEADGDEDGEDNGENLVGSLEEIESRDNIFKLWELEVPEDEEDESELIKQLKKALTLTASKFEPPQREPAAVDELAAALGDLLLEPPSDPRDGIN